MALVIIIGGGGGGGDAVGEPWHAVGAVADGLDVSGGSFTSIDLVGAEGSVLVEDLDRALATGFNLLVLSGDDAGLWLVTPAGPCVFLEDQPQFSGLVLVTFGSVGEEPRLFVGGNAIGNPLAPNTVYIPLGVSLYARTDTANEFLDTQTVSKDIPLLSYPDDAAELIDEVISTKFSVDGGAKHRATFLGATAVDVGIVIVSSGLFVEEHNPLSGFTERLGFASYGFVSFTDAFEPIFRWRFGTATDGTVASMLTSTLVPVQAGAPELDDDLTTKVWVLAQIAAKQSVEAPASAYGTLTATDATPVEVPHSAACFEIFSEAVDTDTVEISFTLPASGQCSFSTLRLVNGDSPPLAWSFGSGVEASHTADLREGASTTYAVYAFNGDTPKVFLSRVNVTEPIVVPDPVWQPVVPTVPYADTVYAANIIANDEPWLIDPTASRHTIQVTSGDDVTIWPFNRIPVQVVNPGPNKFVKIAVNIVNANAVNGVSIHLIDATTGAPAGGISVMTQGAYAIDVFGGDAEFVALWAYRVGSSPIS